LSYNIFKIDGGWIGDRMGSSGDQHW